MNPRRLFTASVTLPATRADLTEALAALESRLPRSQTIQRTDSGGREELRITVGASDIWLAVLLVMNAAAAIGYEPVRLHIGAATEAEAEAYDRGPTPDGPPSSESLQR